MTADGLPRELEELEHVVQAAVRALATASFLRAGEARAVLEDVARQRDGLARFDWPREMPDAERRERVAAHLRTTGLVVADGSGFRFGRPEVADYLVADHLFRRYPRARSLRALKYLAPQGVRPWPDAGMQQILAALWWRPARPVVERRIRRLLEERHRDPNIRFVIDLVRRGLLPDDRVRELVLEVLRGALTEPGRWAATLGWMVDLDAGQALVELESLVANPGPGATDRLRLDAVVEITRHDEVRGAKNLAVLARSLAGEPADRLATAVRIQERDPALGDRALRYFAGDEDMGDLRAEAVVLIGSAELMREFVTAGYGLPDSKRAEILSALLGLPGAEWSEAAERFAAAAEAGTAVRIVERVRGRDAAVALRILKALLAREDLTDGKAGFRAAVLAGEIDPLVAIPALERFAALPRVPGGLRVMAGKRIVEAHGGSPDTLVRLAADAELETSCRGDAAKAVRAVDRPLAARLFIAIWRTGSTTHVAGLNWLREAYECDPGQAVPALAEVVRDRHVPGKVRLQAVAVARPELSRDQAVAWYGTVVGDADDQAALAAAREAAELYGPAGLRLLAKVAERPKADVTLRITAATEAGAEGVRALRGLATTARPVQARFTAAKALLPHDRSAAKTALRAIVRDAEGQIRIRAALALPGHSSIAEALVYVARHDRSHAIRIEAADTAMDYDVRLARPAMQRIFDDPRTPDRFREQARRRLG
ncbi:hypothetical protein Amsp01_091250 [Amycolatopsis sp. NBRC 101858]|uniref:hypothetical protein n=1 Tax=Amycolatopsis sp. NBRC 101858 TaxID=3032200 RepID=UPI0024A239C8|nr:hypothetical protein [Amycolatopsis sp. NBRC 101858]GLY43102.1 hypothetical protein Amsp01_091250 [Amycolatopsis sp. NBRC 101858]